MPYTPTFSPASRFSPPVRIEPALSPFYIASMWVNGITQGLMWRAVNEDGTLTYSFVLGGDSIVSIQVVSRARQAGLQLSPRDLFQLSTAPAVSPFFRPLTW